MEKKLLFVYNPHSGKAQIKTHLAEIIELYTKSGYCVTVHPTSRPKDGFEYIREAALSYDLISVCGGDGMLNEAVNALMTIPKEQRVPLAYLPGGSTNDFAGSVGIPTELHSAVRMLVKGKPFFCDVGKFNDKYFAYVAAFGAFTSVAYDTSQEFKNVFGHMAYIMEGIRTLPNIRTYPVKITTDGKVIENEFLFGMVTNSFQVGGIKHCTGSAVSLNDGLFEVLLVKQPQNPIEFQTAITALLSENFESKHLIRLKTSNIIVESELPIGWTLDGEFGGNVKKADIKNIQNGFSVIV